MVNSMRSERRERGRHDQVVKGAVRVLGDPVPFFFVDHLPLPVDQDSRGARIDDQEARGPEIPIVGPPGSPRFTIPPMCSRAQAWTGVIILPQLFEKHLLRQFQR